MTNFQFNYKALSEDILITCCSSINQPGNSFQSDSYINDFNREFFPGAIWESLILHEHHISQFESIDKILDRRSQITASCPHILNKRDFLRIDLQFLRQPPKIPAQLPIILLDAVIFPENLITGSIESLDSQHDESTVVSASEADIVEIVEADTELGADERIGRRF